MLNINSREPQIIEGEFIDQPSWSELENTCEIQMDRFHLNESVVKFEGYIPNSKELIRFRIPDGKILQLRFSGMYKSHTFFSIESLDFTTDRSNYIRTGSIKETVHMTYFPTQIELHGITFDKMENRFVVNDKPIREVYFEASTPIELNRIEIDKLLLSLSVLTCNHFTLMEICNQGIARIKSRFSKPSEVPYIGSGILFYPISRVQVEVLLDDIKWEHLEKLFLSYSNYITDASWVGQLYKGCGILDRLIDLFLREERFKERSKELKRQDKSAKLYSILYELDLSSKVKEIIEYMFPELSMSELRIDKKFEFYELRDAHLHRDKLFLMSSDLEKYRRSLVVINDLIRILIPKTKLIKEWSFTDKPTLTTRTTKELVSFRQKLIGYKIQ